MKEVRDYEISIQNLITKCHVPVAQLEGFNELMAQEKDR